MLFTDLNEEYNAADYDVCVQSSQHVSFVKKATKEKYDVTQLPSGKFKCTCTGFKYRSTCKHCEVAKKMLQAAAPVRHKREVITNATRDIMPKLRAIAPDAEIVGSYRREKADSKDIDVIMPCTVEQFKQVNDILAQYPNFRKVNSGDNIIRGFITIGDASIEMDINRLAEKMNPALALLYRTGPGDFNMAMRSMAKDLKGSLSENEFILNGYTVEVNSEKDVFDALGIEYLEPKDRSVENIKNRPRAAYNYFKVYSSSGEEIGPAPSRAYAKSQVNQIRDLCKRIAEAPIYSLDGKKLSTRFTVHEDEVPCSSSEYVIRSSKGTVKNASKYVLTINPSCKVSGKRVPLDDKVEYMGKKYTLGDLLEKLWTESVKRTMPTPNNKVSKSMTSGVFLEGGKLMFKSTPYSDNTIV